LPVSQSYALANLRNVPFLSGLSEDALARFTQATTRRSLGRGEVLVQQGDPSDTLYFVTHGRFLVRAGDVAIAEIIAGEPIGEIGFFENAPRSATVQAERASEVLELSRAAYEPLARDMPELNQAVIRALAARVVAGNTARAKLEPRAGKTIAVLPVTGTTLPEGFIAGLLGAAVWDANSRILQAGDAPSGNLASFLAEAEAGSDHLLLIASDPAGTPDWAQAVCDIADTLLFVAPPDTKATTPAGLERKVLDGTLAQNTHLAILRHVSAETILGSAAWLKDRSVGLHHQIALNAPLDFARLGRFLTGTATGVVFCGGAAFGTAHLGMLKALGEHGYAFDMVGGASMGAAMAGGYAMGLAPDDVMDMIDELFLTSRAMKRYTAPVYSVIDHRFMDAQMARLTEGRNIEDLPLPYFAAATSLTTNSLKLLRDGPLWRAMRASSAIPAMFPPIVMPDGEVLIDGGLMDNAPLGPMRDLKAGPNVLLNISRGTDWRVMSDYNELPGRAGALRKLLLPGGKKFRFPGIFSILSRTMVVNAERVMADLDRRDDVVLEMPPLPRMGFLQWGKGRALYKESYRKMTEALEAHPASETPSSGPDDRLRAIAAAQAARIAKAQSERRRG
jgi:NTE family protein